MPTEGGNGVQHAGHAASGRSTLTYRACGRSYRSVPCLHCRCGVTGTASDRHRLRKRWEGFWLDAKSPSHSSKTKAPGREVDLSETWNNFLKTTEARYPLILGLFGRILWGGLFTGSGVNFRGQIFFQKSRRWSGSFLPKILIAKSSKSSDYQTSDCERTPGLLAYQPKQLCGQRQPMYMLRCYTASFRSR